MVDQVLIARSFSTVTCGLLLGSTVWAGVAVMPSIIKSDNSTYAKLSVFDGLIDTAGLVLPPIFISTVASLGYLSYQAIEKEAQVAYGIAAGSLLIAAGLQTVIVPKNKSMQDTIRLQKGQSDDGSLGSRLIGEILYWNTGRIILSAIALGAVLYAAEITRSSLPSGATAARQVAEGLLATKRPEYGLE